MTAPALSIALATYNGARFLAEQLDSFAAQTRLPDELVVGDDGSGDGTLGLLEAFAARVPFPVRIMVNRPGLGPAANFAATIARCTGDIVFLSDQDDIWHPAKLERMSAFLAARADCLVVLHDAELIDGEGRPLGLTMGGQIAAAGDDPARGLVAGCCMAFDRRLAALYDPPPRTETHDAWLTVIADLLGVRGWLGEPLIRYRRHGANVSQSFMSSERPASPWRRWRERAAKALGESAGAALERSLASRASALDALARHRDLLAERIPAERIERAVQTIAAQRERDRRRLALHRAPPGTRLSALRAGLRAGDYAGPQGRISLLRDAAGCLFRSRSKSA